MSSTSDLGEQMSTVDLASRRSAKDRMGLFRVGFQEQRCTVVVIAAACRRPVQLIMSTRTRT